MYFCATFFSRYFLHGNEISKKKSSNTKKGFHLLHKQNMKLTKQFGIDIFRAYTQNSELQIFTQE